MGKKFNVTAGHLRQSSPSLESSFSQSEFGASTGSRIRASSLTGPVRFPHSLATTKIGKWKETIPNASRRTFPVFCALVPVQCPPIAQTVAGNIYNRPPTLVLRASKYKPRTDPYTLVTSIPVICSVMTFLIGKTAPLLSCRFDRSVP